MGDIRLQITQEKFKEWLDYIIEKDREPLVQMAKDIEKNGGVSDWQDRITVARSIFLLDKNNLQPTIDILKTIVDVELTETKDLEIKAWAMHDLGYLTWQAQKLAEPALKYIDMAIAILDNIDTLELTYVTKGEIWNTRCQIVISSGDLQTALIMADEKIKEKEKLGETGNSYLFYAYYAKAQIMHKQEDDKTAALYLYQALKSYPLEQISSSFDKVKEVWLKENEDAQSAFNKMLDIIKREDMIITTVKWKI